VKLHVFDSAGADTAAQVVDLVEDPANGTWAIVGNADWNRKFYLFEVEVYVQSTGRVERNVVTDPYSLSLSMNSRRSQIVNLNDADLKPAGWDRLRKPALAHPVDAVIYELHVRDFSISDDRCPRRGAGPSRPSRSRIRTA
jgi:pullulanase